eukprot:1874824-Prymnesium_polylepis.1
MRLRGCARCGPVATALGTLHTTVRCACVLFVGGKREHRAGTPQRGQLTARTRCDRPWVGV